ncbi:MAG: hypothetical protein GY805_18415, partial [Chloroflexi bacterium]|nr:hypothetical protein [Chloroflexota bacterium]
GLILGLGTVLVVLTIAPPVLSPKEVNWALIASVGVAVVAGGIDFLSPASQLIFPAAQNLILITGSVMVMAYSLLTIRQFSSYTLPTKLIVAFLTVSLIPLGLLAYLNANQTRSTLIDTENQVLFAAASQTATSIDTFIDDTRIAIRTEAQLPTIVKYLSLPANQRSGSREEAEAKETLQKLSHKNRV